MLLSPHEIAWLVIPRWPPPHRPTAVAVFLAESEGDTEAFHRSSDPTSASFGQWDHGLTQISGRWAGDKLAANPDWRDPVVNVDLAFEIWDEARLANRDPWSPWSVYKSRSYEKWLPDATFGLAHPFPPPSLPATRAEVAALRVELAEIRAHFA